MEKQEMSYYLEDLNRVRSLSLETLGQWKEKFPYAQMVHFLMAKKYQLEGFTDDMSIFHRASFYSVDREYLYQRMTNSECETPTEMEWIDEEELNIDHLTKEKAAAIAEESNEEAISSTDLEVESEQMQESIEDEGLSPFAQWLTSLEPSSNASDEVSSTIKTPAKKKKKKRKKKKQGKLASKIKSSVIIQDEIVSEPLALILAQQGHIEKAIKMYEKLSLIFPEKSSFFADQIEKINNSN